VKAWRGGIRGRKRQRPFREKDLKWGLLNQDENGERLNGKPSQWGGGASALSKKTGWLIKLLG